MAHAHEETISGHGRAHPTDRQYVMIALILAAFTAVEIALSYIELNDTLFIVSLLVIMAIKFYVVAAFFMHLRFDSRLFNRAFIAGLVLAVFSYIVVLTSFQYFGGGSTG